MKKQVSSRFWLFPNVSRLPQFLVHFVSLQFDITDFSSFEQVIMQMSHYVAAKIAKFLCHQQPNYDRIAQQWAQ